jgi:putative oligomerization/nucleic acid binding protein
MISGRSVSTSGTLFGFDRDKPSSSASNRAKIERLAELHKNGILSSEEFAAKKAELLSRL